MYFVACIGDILGFVPLVNKLSNIVVGVILGLGGPSGSVFGTFGTFFFEEIPFVGLFPLWTVRVFLFKQDRG